MDQPRRFGAEVHEVNTHDTMISTDVQGGARRYTVVEGSARAHLDQSIRAAAAKRRKRRLLAAPIALLGLAITVATYFFASEVLDLLAGTFDDMSLSVAAAFVALMSCGLVFALPLVAILGGTQHVAVGGLSPSAPDVADRLWKYLTPDDRDRLLRVSGEPREVASAAFKIVYDEYEGIERADQEARGAAARRSDTSVEEYAKSLLGGAQ